jgi:hypothetical protein
MRARHLGMALALLVRPAAGEEPVPGGRVSFAFGGEGSFTMAPADRGYYNDLDYGHNSLRLARLGLSGRLQLGEAAAVLAEVRSENADRPRVHALFLSVRPWPQRSLDVQVGRIPPVFGAYSRRGYAPSEPLAGVPLAYQYLTTLRADAVPASADDMLRQRGLGARHRYPLGEDGWASGLPLVSAFQWDAGVQVRVGSETAPVEVSAALTQGSLSHPEIRDGNGGKQLAARLALRPRAGLLAGLSAARGEYLDDEVALEVARRIGGARRGYHQEALGVDLEHSAGHRVLRAEAVWSRWQVPAVEAPRLGGPLSAWAVFVEGRQRLRPGLTLAARAERLQFSRVRGSAAEQSWDAPVTRLEGALAYSVHRQLVVKAGYQHNWRDSAWRPEAGLAIAQMVVWF